MPEQPDLSVQLGPLTLRNPVMVASGTYGFGLEVRETVDLSRLGALVTKSITPEPRQGHPQPRIVETPSGILNCIGLQNPGVEAFVRDYLPALRETGTPVIVSVAGRNEEEFALVTREVDKAGGAAAIEVNISCPNVREGGVEVSTRPHLTQRTVRAVREATSLPVIPKLSPNVTDLRPIVEAGLEGGADAFSLVNTFLAMKIDVEARRPHLGGVTGGLSGPAIRPIAVRMVWELARAFPEVPLIGMGGVATAQDALEFIISGATAVAVGTANFLDPRTPLTVIDGIAEYLKRHKLDSVSELIGSLRD